MFRIENEQLRVEVAAAGAELSSIHSKKNGLEYLWNGDPAFWDKRSPVLFPVVGRLKNDTFYFGNKAYTLQRHGFAREMTFDPSQLREDSVAFVLESSEETLKHYPFAFRLTIRYSLERDSLHTDYLVENTGKETMYFSIGGHPAFRVPLDDNLTYTDYQLEFSSEESLDRWLVSPEGLIETKTAPLLDRGATIPLHKELFYEDALVLKRPTSDAVTLKSPKSGHGVRFSFGGFPYLGIWAAKDAEFVCIEPWCGIADSVDSKQELVHKEGICGLEPGERFTRRWSIEIF